MNTNYYIGLFSLLLSVVTFSQAATPWQQKFPFVHDDVPFLHDYEKVRVEEKPWSFINVLKDARYLRKMKLMMTHSSQEVEEYFQGRNEIGPAALDLSAYYEFDSTTWSLGAVGDIMYHREGAERFLQPPLTKRLAEQDILFGNLETPVVPSQKPSMLHKMSLRFNAPPALLDTLATGGLSGGYDNAEGTLFDVLSVVNNHSFDRGSEGLKTTMFEVAARGMQCVGVSHRLDESQDGGRYVIIERRGLRVGYVAYTWGINKGILDGPTPGYVNEIPFGLRDEIPDISSLARLLRKCRNEGADIVVASLHWGYEFEYYPLPHFMKIARLVAASGADMIVGHGTHVVQPIEVLHVNLPEYEGTSHYVEDLEDTSPRTCLVAYSLGNFTTVMAAGPCRLGALLSVRIARGKTATGQSRYLLANASIALTYADHKSKFLSSKPLTMYDVDWALSAQNSNDELRADVERALAKVGKERLGAKWLEGEEQWAHRASKTLTDIAINKYECPASYTLQVTGKIVTSGQMEIIEYENIGQGELPLSLINYLSKYSQSLPIPSFENKLGKVRTILTFTPSDIGMYECVVSE